MDIMFELSSSEEDVLFVFQEGVDYRVCLCEGRSVTDAPAAGEHHCIRFPIQSSSP